MRTDPTSTSLGDESVLEAPSGRGEHLDGLAGHNRGTAESGEERSAALPAATRQARRPPRAPAGVPTRSMR